MANLALVTNAKVRPVSGIANGHRQYTHEAEEQINAGQAYRINTTTGKATKANATVVAEAAQSAAGVYNSVLFVAIDGARQAGNAVTGMKTGEIDGFDLSGMAFGQAVFLSDTDGTLADTAGTISTIVGRCVPVPYTGVPSGADRVLSVNCPPVI